MNNTRSTSEKPLVSIVFPVFNEENNLEKLYSEVIEAFPTSEMRYELVFVDNGSTDGSLKIIKMLAKSDSDAKYLSLSRNFGHQGALVAGMNAAKGDAVITMDADLQHPPSLIPEMISFWQKGHPIVITIKRNYHINFIMYFFIKNFYRVLSILSGIPFSFGQSDFRLLDRKVLDIILSIPEQPVFLRGTVEWVGFDQARLEFDVSKRYSGKSKFSLLSLITFALEGITAFSNFPLRLILIIGVFISFLSLAHGLYSFICGLLIYLGHDTQIPSGWSTLASAIFFLGGIQLLCIGIIGEYIGLIFNQGKKRPIFIVKDSSEPSEK